MPRSDLVPWGWGQILMLIKILLGLEKCNFNLFSDLMYPLRFPENLYSSWTLLHVMIRLFFKCWSMCSKNIIFAFQTQQPSISSLLANLAFSNEKLITKGICGKIWLSSFLCFVLKTKWAGMCWEQYSTIFSAVEYFSSFKAEPVYLKSCMSAVFFYFSYLIQSI